MVTLSGVNLYECHMSESFITTVDVDEEAVLTCLLETENSLLGVLIGIDVS